MKYYIISLTLVQIKREILDENGWPAMSIQNEVNVIKDEDEPTAYRKCAEMAKIKHPGHNIVLRVIMDMDEALEDNMEG